jgi:hypothetical protein
VQTRLRTAALTLPGGAWLSLPGLRLRFHSPFLVYQANSRKKAGSGEPDGLPRRDHQGRGLLPAHSLHGAPAGAGPNASCARWANPLRPVMRCPA